MSNIELSAAHLGSVEMDRFEIQLQRFHVFDGSSLIVIDAQSEEDVRYMCREMRWEFICACENFDIVELQAAYWRKQVDTLTAQAEEVRALSTKVTAAVSEHSRSR